MPRPRGFAPRSPYGLHPFPKMQPDTRFAGGFKVAGTARPPVLTSLATSPPLGRATPSPTPSARLPLRVGLQWCELIARFSAVPNTQHMQGVRIVQVAVMQDVSTSTEGNYQPVQT